MKPETIESLLIDRALNEVSPEVVELLDAYLAQNPSAAAGVAQIGDAIELARQAVAVPDKALQRGFAVEPAQRRSWLDWFQVPRIELVRLAACLALGLALGLAVPSVWRMPTTVYAPSPARYVVASARTERADDSTSQFWSLAALAAERQVRSEAGRATKHDRLQWDSLFKMPRLEKNQ